jgi:hypothetical protein
MTISAALSKVFCAEDSALYSITPRMITSAMLK